MASNKEIAKQLKLMASLMELYDENPFKVRAYSGAVYAIEKMTTDLASLSELQLAQLEGIGKGVVSKILEIHNKGTFEELEKLTASTPMGVVDMLRIKGIGPKKVKTLWREAGMETIEALLLACESGQIAQIKGFGEKTQQTILENIVFLHSQEGWFYYAEAEPIVAQVEEELNKAGLSFSLSGDMRRKMETVEELKFLAASADTQQVFPKLDKIPILHKEPKHCSPYAWRGKVLPSGIKIEIKVAAQEEFGSRLILDSAGSGHLEKKVQEQLSLSAYFRKNKFPSEAEAYRSLQYPVFLPEIREGLIEFDEKFSSLENPVPELVKFGDLKGALHNHTTYSDGEHSLLQMAQKCIQMGWQYFGVADHSKSAQYASGLYEEKVLQQQKEIDELNIQLAPFRILKGTESDILTDGSLDYDDTILKTFDYVVASVHSGLKMNEERATSRLIKAIENPFTTILGHPTSRLLLRRKGYPLDHKKIIDACAANQVCIEINANPYRLDLDWRWIPYALEKEVMLAINPDSHEMDGLNDMYYGVQVARKGGLTPDKCLNTFPLQQILAYFSNKSALVI